MDVGPVAESVDLRRPRANGGGSPRPDQTRSLGAASVAAGTLALPHPEGGATNWRAGPQDLTSDSILQPAFHIPGQMSRGKLSHPAARCAAGSLGKALADRHGDRLILRDPAGDLGRMYSATSFGPPRPSRSRIACSTVWIVIRGGSSRSPAATMIIASPFISTDPESAPPPEKISRARPVAVPASRVTRASSGGSVPELRSAERQGGTAPGQQPTPVGHARRETE